MVTGLLTSQEAADRLGISERTLRKLRQEGEIRYVAITDHKILYRPEDVEEYIESRLRRETPLPRPRPTFNVTASVKPQRGFMEQVAERRSALSKRKRG